MSLARSVRTLSVAAALGLLLATGCTVPVAEGLEESEANRVVTALEASGIPAEKTTEPGSDGRYRIEVSRDDAARAVSVLTADGLPPQKTQGVLEALDTNALVPSRIAEQARLLAGISGELERSLGSVDGVLSARVHLAAPRKDPLAGDEVLPLPSASVLIRYRGAKPPMADADVRRLVAFAVPGLSPDHVAVVDAPAAALAPRDVAYVGPFSASPATAKRVRVAIASIAVLNLALVGCLIAMWVRLRRLRAGPDDESSSVRERT